MTADGKHFELAANIGTPKDVEGVNANGAEAVGLYRTEFLYMDSQDFPTEDEQYEAYKAVLEGMNGKPVVFVRWTLVEIRNFLTSICHMK